jgi:hypothetical protein
MSSVLDNGGPTRFAAGPELWVGKFSRARVVTGRASQRSYSLISGASVVLLPACFCHEPLNYCQLAVFQAI